MSRYSMFLLLLFAVCFCFSAFSQNFQEADPQSVAKVLTTYQGAGTTEMPVVHKNARGFIRFLYAPEGGYFATPATGQKSIDISDTVKEYMEQNIRAFSGIADKTTLQIKSIQEREDYDIVRLTQNYMTLPVFGSGIVVKVTKDAKIVAISSDILRDDTGLTTIDFSQPFPVDKAKAIEQAVHFIRDNSNGVQNQDIKAIEDTYLAVYDPVMLKQSGAPCVVYVVTLTINGEEKKVYRLLVDAVTGEIRLSYPLHSAVINREIYDANGSYNIPTTIARKEGDKETGIAEIDNTFDYLGDAYNFFAENHDRDSYDDKGATLRAVVRIPVQNAYWDPTRKLFWFGTGFSVDDVVAHEYTHSVVEYVADLVYFGEPGAITESFCDMWGEFVDLTNGKGLDTEAVRWLIGEELPSGVAWEGWTAIRSMKEPTAYNQPDRYNSPLFIQTTYSTLEDNGGVHTNSGVGNKLAYLLTDGDTFNGEQVRGFGIVRTAKLFYGALELLPPVADYTMLALALNASALSQGLSIEDRFNISRALNAVEILPEELTEMSARDFRATSLLMEDDTPAILLSWTPPSADAYSQVTLVKKAGSYPTSTVDGDKIFEGKGSYFLDVNVSAGIEYFYSLFVDMVELPPVEMYDSAVAGGYAPQVLTQEFKSLDPRKPVASEIIYSQIYFIPTGAPTNPLDGNKYLGGYYNYDAIFIPEIFSFPVKRQDSTGSSYTLPFSTDGLVSFDLTDVQFPFFGKKYGTIYVGANGYITFVPVALESTKNFPSLSSHFAIPRISFLFSDLAPDSAGEVWTRRLPDRFVITFENIPKDAEGSIPNPLSGAGPGSSVQVELFFSGHIRITYLQLDPNYCIVGLSDGRGIPVDPGQLLPSSVPYSLQRYTNFSQLPSASTRLSFSPSPLYTVLPNQDIRFEVTTWFAGGNAPQLYAEWLRND
ncbi:MAG: M4 family metallopeptidase, partial [Candidatus Hydrogenedens sp.]